MENMENVPKILPVWNDYYRCQSLAPHGKIPFLKFCGNGMPDFGGFGVDVHSGNTELKLTKAKHFTDKVIYGAHVCSLPFCPPKEVHLQSDPCMASICALRDEIIAFNYSLSCVEQNYKNPKSKTNRRLSSLYSALKKKKEEYPICDEEFFVPATILNMAAQQPLIPQSSHVPESNFNYLGGCLVSSKTVDGIKVLLHPTGKSLNKLGITPLVENNSPNKTFRTASPTYRSKKLKKTCIEKIRSNFEGQCFVQQDKSCSYINFTNPSEICINEIDRVNGRFVNIQTSPYTPVDFLSTDEDGVLEVFDIESWKTSWCSDALEDSTSDPLLKDLSFGSHPKSILLLTENSVNTYDLRSKSQSGSRLFSKHFSNFPWEKFSTLKNLDSFNPFQSLISSAKHLYIIDERYPEKPVLTWNHLFRTMPFYCDVACVESLNSSDAIALLGSQQSAELCLFSIRFTDGEFQPTSISNPLYPSVTTDFCDSLKLHCVHVPVSLERRVKNPLVGVSIVPHSKEKGFTCFQLSSYGDIFYQDFSEVFQSDRELTYKVGTGCVLSPPSRILPHISSWTDYFSEKAENFKFTTNPPVISDVQYSMTEAIEKSSHVSLECKLCTTNPYGRDKGVIISSRCPSCGMDTKQTDDILKKFRSLDLCAGPSKEESKELLNFDWALPSGFDCEESQRILAVWNSSSEEFKPHGMDTDSGKSVDSSPSSGLGNTSLFQSLVSKKDSNEEKELKHSSFNEFKPPGAMDIDTKKSVDSSPSKGLGNISLFRPLLSCKDSNEEKEPKYDLNSSHDSTCDLIPPSQDVRPFVGETIRTSQAKLLNSTDSFEWL